MTNLKQSSDGNTIGIYTDGDFRGFYIQRDTWYDESNEVPSLLQSYLNSTEEDQAHRDYKSFLLLRIQNLFSNSHIADIKFYENARIEDLRDEYVEIEIIW